MGYFDDHQSSETHHKTDVFCNRVDEVRQSYFYLKAEIINAHFARKAVFYTVIIADV